MLCWYLTEMNEFGFKKIPNTNTIFEDMTDLSIHLQIVFSLTECQLDRGFQCYEIETACRIYSEN